MNPLQFAEIIDVKGIKVRAEVYSKKNTTMLLHYGEIIKNVSVGSYVKIVKGFTQIIGVVEGEYVNESNKNNKDFVSSEEVFKRVIEVKVLGTLEGLKFKRGITDMPLLYNPVFVLSPKEFNTIFSQNVNKDEVPLGTLTNDETVRVNVNINGLLNGHIGIFGNTGSGKSNTLAKLYKEIFNVGLKGSNFHKSSRFVFIDFNGEYTKDSLSRYKHITEISTRTGKDRYKIPKEFIFEAEMLSIILEATEKTQKPFIKRCLRFNDNYVDELFYSRENIVSLMGTLLFENRVNIEELQKYFNDFMRLITDKKDFWHYFNKFRFIKNPRINALVSSDNNNDYIDELDQLLRILEIDLDDEIFLDISEWSYEKKLDLSFMYKFLDELGKGYIAKEHIAPLMKRLDDVFTLLSKSIEVVENEAIDKESIEVVNMKSTNLYAKKILPLIICKYEYESHIHNDNNGTVLNIVIDEAHNILSSQSDRESKEWKDYRLEVFEEIVKEGRKFGVFLTIASQRPSDISSTLVSQLNHYFIHRLMNQEDLNKIQSTVTFLDKNSFDMIPSLPPGGCILTGSSINFPIMIQVDRLMKNERPNSEDYDIVKLWKIK